MGKDHELLEAARTGNISIVEKLLHSKSKSSTFAASLGIRVGANVNCQDQNGYTPLHHASLNGHSEIVVLLLEDGASVNTPDIKGSCPLHLAAWNGISNIVEILLTTGPSFANVNDQNGDKETPLHCSAQHGHQESVKILLENHADPELRNIRDESALDLASQYGRLEVVRLLLMYHPKLLAHSPERFAPLHLASRNGHREVVELLLVHGADINKVGANGTALHEAALFGKYGVVSLLLKRGADPSAKDSSGRTSLELVSQLDTQISRDIAKLIIARIQDGEDYEPLRSIITSTPNNKPADIRAKNIFDKPTNVFATISSAKVSRNLSRSFGEADLASNSSRGPSSLRSSKTQLSPESTKSHRIRLRRTSSARSARSLPRLASTASYVGNRSLHSFSHGKKSDVSMQDWSIRQHHPSIDMFPVTPTRASQTSRKTSASEPSSPHLGFSSLIDTGDDSHEILVHDTPFRGDDDCVFFPGTPTMGRPNFETFLPSVNTPKKEPTAILPLKPPADDFSESKNVKKSSNLPTKPVSVLVTQPTLSGSEVKLSLDLSRNIPPPLPRKMSTSPPCGKEPKSPILTKNNSKTEKVKDLENTQLAQTDDVTTLSRTPEGHSVSVLSLNSWSSHGFSVSESSASDFSPTVRSPNAPQKPQRHKPDLTPPPLPPKPAHMAPEAKKVRPPSPAKPPPSDDDEDVEGDEKDIFEDALSLSSIEGTQVMTPTFEPVALSESRFRGFQDEGAKESLSPPGDSNHSGSTSTASTVIFVPSPTATIRSESGNIENGGVQSGDSEIGADQFSDAVNVKQTVEEETANSVTTQLESGMPSTTSSESDNHNAAKSEPGNTIQQNYTPQTDSNLSEGCQNIIVTQDTDMVARSKSNAELSMSPAINNTAPLTTINSNDEAGDSENFTKQTQAANFSTSKNTTDTTTSKTPISSPTLQSPSPPFSPPSPNTAMLQVSSALQKIVTCNQAKPTEKSSNINTVKTSMSTKTILTPRNGFTEMTETILKPSNDVTGVNEPQINISTEKSDLTGVTRSIPKPSNKTGVTEPKIIILPEKADPTGIKETFPKPSNITGVDISQSTSSEGKSVPTEATKTISKSTNELTREKKPQIIYLPEKTVLTEMPKNVSKSTTELTGGNKPQSIPLIEKTDLTVKPALPKKRFPPTRQPRRSIDNSFIQTPSQNESGDPKTDKLGSKSLTNMQAPAITIEKPRSPPRSKSIHIMSPKPYENDHKSVLVRHESKSQMRPQSELYYTATEVKRARICSTKSVIEIPSIDGEYDNADHESQIMRNKRSSSLGPQVKTPYTKSKPAHVESEVQTISLVRKVSDAYTQTYPPKFSNQRKLSLQKSRSVDVFHKFLPKPNGSLSLQHGAEKVPPIRPSNLSVKKSQKPVPKIKQPLVTTPPSAIRAKRLQKPVKPAKPAHLLNYKPSVKRREGLKGKENLAEVSNDLILSNDVKTGLDESFHSTTSPMDTSSLADKTAISVLSLDTSDDWNDALSDRTEDMNFPTTVRKYRGLIRGSSLSYRSKFAPCTGRDPAYDSDEFEYDYQFNSKAAYSRVNASLQPDDEIDGRKFSASVTKQTNNTGFRQGQAKDISIPDSLMGEKCNVLPAKKPKNSTGEPGEKRRKEDILLPNTSNTVKSQGGFINYAHSRDSSYDNNNNNNNREEDNLQSSSSTTSLPITMTTAPILSSPMSEGLPDFGTIVDTVTAVRKKTSPQGSTSGVSSTSSSQSSTLAKQDPASFNENDEWAQIANVMKSVGSSLNKGSVYAQEFEETFWRIMTGSNLPTSVSAWLSDLNLSHYEDVICGNGFDNINFLASDILAEQDLIDMNIQNPSHRRRMLDSAKNLPKIRSLTSSSEDRKAPSSVGEWLRLLALGDHEDLFINMGFNTLDKVLKMRDTEIAGIVRLRGHRKRIRASIGQSSKPVAKPRSTTQSNSRTGAKLKSSPPLPRSPLLDKINFFKDYSQKNSTQAPVTNSYGTASSSSSAFTNCSGFSDQVVPIAISEDTETTEFPARINRSYSASTEPYHQRHTRDPRINRFPSLPGGSLNPQEIKTEDNIFDSKINEDDLLTQAISRLTDGTVKKSGNTQEQDNKENMSTSDSTEVRVPDARRASYLSSNGDLILRPPNETTEEEVTVSSWCHDPEVLIKSCCNYQAYYLGSMLVHEVKGVQSTVEACAKMKKSTDSMKKIPTVTLSISYKGVKFIDSKSKHEIAEHEIQNISFASQDADDLSTLAYITRDARTDNHYCHVFRVTTLDVAYEIILTLGQAFEVAYQLILKEKETQKDSS